MNRAYYTVKNRNVYIYATADFSAVAFVWRIRYLLRVIRKCFNFFRFAMTKKTNKIRKRPAVTEVICIPIRSKYHGIFRSDTSLKQTILVLK